jgi:predicted aspartyl protease
VGQLYVPVTLRNAREYVLARHGHLAADQVHTYESPHALVDTGALHVVLPPHVAEQLGLLLMGYTGAAMADGRLVQGEMSEPVTIELLRRQISINALIMGETILLGALVLEGLDRAVDCARGQLMPDLGTWDQPVFRV